MDKTFSFISTFHIEFDHRKQNKRKSSISVSFFKAIDGSSQHRMIRLDDDSIIGEEYLHLTVRSFDHLTLIFFRFCLLGIQTEETNRNDRFINDDRFQKTSQHQSNNFISNQCTRTSNEKSNNRIDSIRTCEFQWWSIDFLFIVSLQRSASSSTINDSSSSLSLFFSLIMKKSRKQRKIN